MPWPPADSSTRSQLASSVEALRVATLQASWSRDRRVARRRLAWRWLVWAWWRYLLPVAVVLGGSAWLAMGLLPPASRWLSAAPVATSPTSRSQSLPPATRPDPTLTAEGEPIELGRPDQDPLTLQFDSRWAAPRASAPVPTLPSGGNALPAPVLTPETWLHSKEP